MGQIGIELTNQLDNTDGFFLKTSFEHIKSLWSDQNKISKKLNQSLNPLSVENPNLLSFQLSDFPSNTLLYEYLINPKEIKVIPVSLQFR